MNPYASKAMLACLSISQWGNRKFERKVTNAIADAEHTDRAFLSTTKKLLGKDATSMISAAVARARDHHYTNTLPWQDSGYRLLPSANYFKYVEKERAINVEFKDAVESFLKVYPGHREVARVSLNGLFNENDYPSVESMRSKYSMESNFLPFPDSGDLRIDIPAAEIAKISQNVDARVAEALKQATADLFKRVVEVVSALRDKLVAYNVNAEGKIDHPFRDTAITNLRDLAELLPRLNVTEDPDLAALQVKLMQSLCPLNPDQLRNSNAARDQAVRSADDILNSLAGYVGDMPAAEAA
jgi:hypothetical protein